MKLSMKTIAALREQAHPDLVKVVLKAAELYKGTFVIIEISRTKAQQKKNLARGVSQTSNSRHVPENNQCHLSCAVDIAPTLADGKTIPWKQWNKFAELNVVMMAAAKAVGVPIEWGGNWKTIKDGDHWQLPWKQYP
jgi:peptidoglycan L-alanyl-D-glutamate endopeptidase CwlK